MPSYIYSDGRHKQTVVHRMFYSTAVLCSQCGAVMHRIPQVVGVNWGQLRPSQGGLHPDIKRLVETADERRDRYFAKKAARAAASGGDDYEG